MKTWAYICVAVLAVAISMSRAGTIHVVNTDDSGPGSLRSALATVADGDTVDASSITGTITLISSQLVITNSVDVFGPGPANLALDGNFTNRVLYIGPGTTVTVSGMAIKNGVGLPIDVPYRVGGGLYIDHADAIITNCMFTGNSAEAGGGVFYSSSDRVTGTVVIVECTVSNNTAGAGGGIYLFAERFGYLTATIRDSTISSNSAPRGGGIYADGSYFGIALVFIESSLLSSNSAGFYGGAIYNDGIDFGQANLHLLNTTVTGNHANLGGGIYGDSYIGDSRLTIANSTFNANWAVFGGAIFNTPVQGKFQMDIGNTILRAGDSGENIGVESNVPVTSHGFNLCSDDGNSHLTATGDQVNTEPLLGPLLDNGGPTLTHALLCGSPAIDRGRSDTIPSLASATDQRGSSRTVDDPSVVNAAGGDGTDIGAFEAQGTGLSIARCRSVTVFAGESCTASASIDAQSSKPDRPCDVLTITQSPPGPYALGENLVTLTIADAFGGTNSCEAIVTVVDDASPQITCPANIVVTGVCAAAAVVLGTPTAIDNCSVAGIVSNAQPVFPTGTNVVTWTATDGSGNTNVCQQLVIVFEIEPPSIVCPVDITVDTDPGKCSASGVVLGEPTVSDNCAGTSAGNNAPTIFPIGTNVVTWTAQDTSGNTNTCQQTVIVEDHENPTILCPDTMSVPATTTVGTSVTLPAPVVSDNCGGVTVSSIPDSGSVFPVGDTTVAMTATDGAGNTNLCTFIVHVQGPIEQISEALVTIASFELDSKLTRNLIRSFGKIGRKITDGKSDRACSHLTKLVASIAKRHSKGQLSAEQAAELTAAAQHIRSAIGCDVS